MLNLFDYLTDLDNKRIENYITTYGVHKKLYEGNEKYLKYWSECKPSLFRLLGGKLIYKFPVEITKPLKFLREEYETFFNKHNCFYHTFLDKVDTTPALVSFDAHSIFCSRSFIEEQIDKTIKVKREGASKMLQLQRGMKPVRAMQKIIDYYDWKELKEPFEKFRTDLSLVTNDKLIKGNACISIHPLDFLTMSDNDSDWSSCMSWVDNGCYHAGTVEMMNSNNVLCCYLESKTKDFYFGKKEDPSAEEREAYTWNNKKWRQLFYVTKEIAVGGKAYSFQNKELTLLILDEIKKLVEKNWHRTYAFGPELYRDMIHTGSLYRINQNRSWIYRGKTTKHNILFQSKGMYNDMFNDQSSIYWCYRNKVKKNTVITYSGKAPCLCCGENVLAENISNDITEWNRALDNYQGAYNDRYDNTGSVVCYDCKRDHSCTMCGNADLLSPLYELEGKKYCSSCANKYFKVCPDCGKVFEIDYAFGASLYGKTTEDEIYQQDFYNNIWNDETYDPKYKYHKVSPVVGLYMCPFCMMKKKADLKDTEIIDFYPKEDSNRSVYYWVKKSEYPMVKKTIDINNSKWSKYLLWNLQTPNFNII